jgi:hypothetical protein
MNSDWVILNGVLVATKAPNTMGENLRSTFKDFAVSFSRVDTLITHVETKIRPCYNTAE